MAKNRRAEQKQLLDEYAKALVTADGMCQFCLTESSRHIENGVYVICDKCGEVVNEIMIGDYFDKF